MTELTSPYSLNAQREWHTSELVGNQSKAATVSRLYFENLLLLIQTSTLPQAGLTGRLFNVYTI